MLFSSLLSGNLATYFSNYTVRFYMSYTNVADGSTVIKAKLVASLKGNYQYKQKNTKMLLPDTKNTHSCNVCMENYLS